MEPLQFLLQLLISFVALAGALVVPLLIIYAIGRWILNPIDQLGKQRQGTLRYRIVDFFCLFFIIQVVLAAYMYGFSRPQSKTVMGITLTLVVALMWFQGIKRPSRAAIEGPWRRAVFNIYVLPNAYFGSVVAIPGILVLVVTGTTQGFGSLSGRYWFFGLVVPAALIVAKFGALWVASPPAQPAPAKELRNPYDTG